jgi:CubicO group peptidase (beta-lactamase class C family)
MTLEAGLAAVDAIAARHFPAMKAPGLAYGIVAGGRLVHVRGLGTARVGEDATPDADTVFRIASMTKSFTAATVLSLRDDGRLGLDDPAVRTVPDLAGVRLPTTDSPQITIRQLLSMTAGLPTDNPWGDRIQGMPLDEFARLLRGGLTFSWAPGTRWDYANLDYGILGRVITAAAGLEYKDAVRARLLRPLGLASTTFELDEVPPGRFARGYLRRDDAWLEEPIDPYGANAPMGGIFTTVRDLAAWIAFFLDAEPPRDDPDAGPLSRASRREMGMPLRAYGPAVTAASTDAEPELGGASYGYGLFSFDHLRWGRFVGHSGGYPGYGTNMRWHPASGLGIVALANGRYAPSTALVAEAFPALLAAEAASVRRVRPLPETEAARAAVESLLARWDDALAARTFAFNVDLDEPLERRRAAIEALRDVHGRLVPDPSEPPVSASPAELVWWLAGAKGGRVRLEILLTAERPARVQTFSVTSVPEPHPALRAVAAHVAAALVPPAPGGPAPAWPVDPALPGLAPALDRSALDRAVRAAEARFSPLTLGPVLASVPDRSATFRLQGDRGRVELQLERDPASGELIRAALVPARLSAGDIV